MLPGRATPEATAAYARRLSGRVAEGHLREGLGGLTLSSIGLGSYLGEMDAETDEMYVRAVHALAAAGGNVIDTAINYRCQLSERAIGRALAELAAEGIGREEILVCTKGGFIPMDAAVTLDIEEYVSRELLEPGIIARGDVVAGCHVMTPRYIRHAVEQSRRNLGLETLDVYYLHNPETQLAQVGREEFYRRLRDCFAELEALAAEAKIGVYGTATWDGFRVAASRREHLSLRDLVSLAREAAGGESRFAAVQLPFNLGMTEALTAATQMIGGREVSLLDAAGHLRVAVFASASLLQSHLIGRIPTELQAGFPGLKTDAQRAIQFTRSVPGIQTALVGMKTLAHVEENMMLAAVQPLTPEQFQQLFGGASGK
jgi:aryl-alcohol dehydrogenase-like predicted oxidoreductase